MNRTVLLIVFTIFLLNSYVFAEANWPQFRGSSGGIAEDKVLPVSWSTTENVVWKVDILGRGWSCPVVWGDKVFLTTVASEGNVEEARKGLYRGGDRNKASSAVHHWIVYCFDWHSGKTLWQKTVHKGKPAQPVHIKNTYASETPVTDGERVYFYFGNVGVFCFDLEGKALWRKNVDPAKNSNNWGTAASPVLYKDRLYIVNDNEEQSFLVALDKKTGKQIWRTERDEKGNWATPYIWQNKQRTELITSGRGKVRSYDLDGRLLWELGGMSSIVIPTPLAKHDLLYICSGYVGDRKNRPVYAIRPGASGDITPKDEHDTGKYIAWYHKFGGPYNPSPIAYGDYLYVLYDRGTVSCYDGHTGKVVYEKQQLAKDARAFTASPWANDGKLFFLSEDGDTFVIEAGPTFKVLGRNKLNEMCMATPAALRGSLIIRTISKLYRIQD
jgi:outer membrane protein assembly factor BamB